MKRTGRLAMAVTALSMIAAGGLGVGLSSASAATAPNAFTAYVGVGNPAALTALSQRTGTQIGYATDYFDDRSWAQIDDTWDMNNWAGSGYRMIWGVPMLPVSGATLATGATGAYDQYFVTVAKDLVAHGMGNSVLRLGWEFNTSTYPWYAAGQAPAFVAYWRHIVTAMRSVAGTSFTFEWNPTMGDNGGGDTAMGNFANYYPGDAYVDLVALDVYDIAWNTYPGETAQFSSIQTRTWGLNWLATFATQHSKPLAIAEFGLGWGGSAGDGKVYSGSGTVSGGDNPGFVRDMAAWMRQHASVINGFWDIDFSSIEGANNPLTAAAVTTQFAAATTSPTTSPTPTATPTPTPTSTATPTPTKKHGRAHIVVQSVVPSGPSALAVSGQLLPAQSGSSVVVQTAGSAHATHWTTHQHTRTHRHGHYRVVLLHSHHARYLRVVATVNHRAARSHAIAIA